MLEIILYVAVGLSLVYYLIMSIRTAQKARKVQLKIQGHNTMRGTAVMLTIIVVFLLCAFPTRYMLCLCVTGIVLAIGMFIQRSGIMENGILYQSKFYPWDEVLFMQLTPKKNGAYMFGFGARKSVKPRRETAGTILFYREQYSEISAVIDNHRKQKAAQNTYLKNDPEHSESDISTHEPD